MRNINCITAREYFLRLQLKYILYIQTLPLQKTGLLSTEQSQIQGLGGGTLAS